MKIRYLPETDTLHIGLTDRDSDVTPFAGPVLLRAGGWSGRFPLVEDLQGRTPLER